MHAPHAGSQVLHVHVPHRWGLGASDGIMVLHLQQPPGQGRRGSGPDCEAPTVRPMLGKEAAWERRSSSRSTAKPGAADGSGGIPPRPLGRKHAVFP